MTDEEKFEEIILKEYKYDLPKGSVLSWEDDGSVKPPKFVYKNEKGSGEISLARQYRLVLAGLAEGRAEKEPIYEDLLGWQKSYTRLNEEWQAKVKQLRKWINAAKDFADERKDSGEHYTLIQFEKQVIKIFGKEDEHGKD